MYFFYILVSILIYPLFLLVLIPLSFKDKYSKLYQKFLPFKKHKIADIHFHFASYGEAVALGELIKYYKNKGFKILLTCSSKTGLMKAKEFDDNAFLLPYEPLLYLWLKPAKTLMVFEAELWLALLKIYKDFDKNTILLNARMKENSFKNYKKFSFYYAKIFSYFDLILAQSNEDKERLEYFNAKNIEVFTNIKITNKPIVTKQLSKNKEIILIASTHENEEEIILNKLDKNFLKDKCLIIAPRHPERFHKVEKLLYNKGFNIVKYSNDCDGYLKSEVFLLDTLGELINFYSISDYVILGGSYTKIGGHNFAEAAFFGCKITSGTNVFSQYSSIKCIENIKISDDIDFTNVKNAKIKNEYTFNALCEILDRKINETR
ncbi:glycosyltransferase N-terminal domain-containing protein [Campylobacter sp. RM12651]|uniref:glycosyltransferase N-terminal domain-containing protein n=1 Tax=Campylobacter sp. RM12651 TaxID=1660079 RepID=UPI001EFA99B7|nr:glycosyltransferase N-terminal domain-containing protein [Campylobacter sp. RM12651]ULO02878.1 3-deoxy-D-manno-octulosonic-acid transferase (KDO transferase) [Campylobacter sp. RM12651]